MEYIVPIFCGNSFGGVGVFAKDLFITAGHVAHLYDEINICYKGKKCVFKKEDALLLSVASKENPDFDIAVYKQQIVVSPLVLAREIPSITLQLHSLSCELVERHTEPIDSTNIFSNISNLEIEMVQYDITGKLEYVEGNFFLCNMDEPLKVGFSGSPIMRGNVIYGFLSGAIDDDHGNGRKCVYQSSLSLVEMLQA